MVDQDQLSQQDIRPVQLLQHDFQPEQRVDQHDQNQDAPLADQEEHVAQPAVTFMMYAVSATKDKICEERFENLFKENLSNFQEKVAVFGCVQFVS
jgi:hypothetical protein